MITDQENNQEVEESLDLPEVKEGEEDTTDWKGEAQKLREKAIAQRERTKSLKQQLKEAKDAVEKAKVPETTVAKPKQEGLDETALDYLDVKGITERDDIKIVEDIVKKTGMTVREALKDDYVSAKLEANKAARAVKAAVPSATRRAGEGSSDGFDAALAKFEKDGSLPDDFELRKKIVNAKYQSDKGNKPSWHK